MPVYTDVADNLIGYAVNVARFSAEERRFALQTLRQLERDLTKELRAVDPTGVGRTRYQQKRLETLLKQTRVTIRNAYGAISRKVDKDMIELSELTAESMVDLTNAAVGFDVMTTATPPTLLRQIATDTLIEGSKSRDWWARQAGDTRFRFENAMRDGVLRGETIQQLGKRARDVMPTSRRNAEALARTVTINVSNEAALRTFQENDDVIEAIEWVSTLDSRTTDICRALDGLKWTIEGYKPIGHDKVFPGATAHWACRSTQVPVIKEEERLPPSKRKGANKVGTRASKPDGTRGGQVSADLDYESWLRRRTKAEQLKILGPGRYQLWKTGKLTQRDFTDNLNRPLTLAELKEKLKIAKRPKPRPKKPKPVIPPKIDNPKPPTKKAEKTLTQAEIGRQRVAGLARPIDDTNGPALLAHFQQIGRMTKALPEEARSIAKEIDQIKREHLERPLAEYVAKKDEVKTALSDAKKRLNKLNKEWRAEIKEIHDELFSGDSTPAMKYAIDRVQFQIHKRRGSYAIRDRAIQRTARFAQMFGNWLPPSLKFVSKRKRRAYAHKTLKKIDIGGGSETTVFHEIGHHVEFSDKGIEAAAQAFRDSRATSSTPQTLRKLTGNPRYPLSEKALPDDFLDPYVGKVYSDGATEVVSMGLEQFADLKRLENFAANHPEHFEFMLGIIRAKRYE